jgi:hypothetical protein
MGLFGNKKDRQEKVVDKYEYHQSKQYQNNRSPPYGPPALSQTPPSPYLSGGGNGYYGQSGYDRLSAGGVGDYGQQQKMNKYKHKNMYAPMGGMEQMFQQPMMLPPSTAAAIQQQATQAMMQQYMMNGGANNVNGGIPPVFGGVLPPITMPLAQAQQAGLLGAQGQQQFGSPYGNPFIQQQQPQMMAAMGMMNNPFVDPMMMQQQQGAFSGYSQMPYGDPQQYNYGYMPAY